MFRKRILSRARGAFFAHLRLTDCFSCGIAPGGRRWYSAPAPTYNDWQIMGTKRCESRVVTIEPARARTTCFVSTLDGVNHTSTDGGNTWRAVNLNQPDLSSTQLIVDSLDSDETLRSCPQE